MDERPTPDRTRRPGVDALPTRLADGQSWGLALPAIRLRPRVVVEVDPLGRPSETIRVEAGSAYPLAIRRLVDDLRDACGRGTPEVRYEALIRLASALLRRAHDLGPAEAAGLLELGVDEIPAFVEAVLSAISGGRIELPLASRKGDGDARD